MSLQDRIPDGIGTDDAARASACLAARRWDEAAAWLEPHIDRAPIYILRYRLARNLAALDRHRPEALAAIVAARDSGRYQVDLAPGGGLTITGWEPPGPEDGPTPTERSGALALRLGDGALLAELAPTATALWIIEPDVELATYALMLHDFTGPQGPIESPRALWALGPTWGNSLRRAWARDPQTPRPGRLWGAGATLTTRYGDGIAAAQDDERSERAHIAARYDETGAVAAILGRAARGDQALRLLVIASRHRPHEYALGGDLAAALRRLGHEVRLYCEGAPPRELTPRAILGFIGRWMPALAFSVDRPRTALGGALPESLPLLTWFLQPPPDGAELGPRDLALAWDVEGLARLLTCSLRQCLPLPRYVARDQTPAPAVPSGPDIVHLKDAPPPPRELVQRYLQHAPRWERPLLDGVMARVIDIHQRDGALDAPRRALATLLDSAARATGHGPLRDERRRALIDTYLLPLAATLQRLQALTWASRAAESLGLELALHGEGWQAFPELSRHARGPLSAHEQEALCRSAAIQLFLEPGTLLDRVDFLEALQAGAFQLLRADPADAGLEALETFLARHVPAEARTLVQARTRLDERLAARLDILCERVRGRIATPDDDPLAHVRRQEGLGLLADDRPILPHRDRVSFHDEMSLRARIAYYHERPLERSCILQAQRADLAQRHGLSAVLRRVLDLAAQRAGPVASPSRPA